MQLNDAYVVLEWKIKNPPPQEAPERQGIENKNISLFAFMYKYGKISVGRQLSIWLEKAKTTLASNSCIYCPFSNPFLHCCRCQAGSQGEAGCSWRRHGAGDNGLYIVRFVWIASPTMTGKTYPRQWSQELPHLTHTSTSCPA
jgi:hypothetical protein